MSKTSYCIDTTSDTKGIIHDGLWELVKAGNIIHDIPNHYFTGPFAEGNKLEISTQVSYVKNNKIYDRDTFNDQVCGGSMFGKKRMKFARRVELHAQMKLNDWINNRMLDSTLLKAVFYVDHTQVSEAFLGLKMYGWSRADDSIELEHPVEVSEEDIRTQGMLIYKLGKDAAVKNKAELDKMLAIFAKVKI